MNHDITFYVEGTCIVQVMITLRPPYLTYFLSRWAETDGEGLTTGWFRGFARRNGFKMVCKKDLDVVRARWTTAANVGKFYDIFFAAAVGLGAAEALPNVTLDREGASQLKIFHPHLWVSMDETCVSLSPEVTHANGQAISGKQIFLSVTKCRSPKTA